MTETAGARLNRGTKLRSFLRRLASFEHMATITPDQVPGDCKFVADPFIRYDAATDQWVVFAEVAFAGRRQFIGTFTSPDLSSWKYNGDAIKGSRESFPSITPRGSHYLMTPCVDASPAPGLVPVYKAEELLGPWRFSAAVVLSENVTDRLLARLGAQDVLIYGTSTRWRRKLLCAKAVLSDGDSRLRVQEPKLLLSDGNLRALNDRLHGRPRLTMRPAGGLIEWHGLLFLPLQGTREGGYGECWALAMLRPSEENILDIEDVEFVDVTVWCSDLVASHHFSFCEGKGVSAFAIDGRSDGSGWNVRIFSDRGCAYTPGTDGFHP